MSTINQLGLPQKQTAELVDKLNILLANYQVYYQNARALHWNIKGKRFFDLHVKFEEFYNDAQLKVDEIAERILTLGGTPLHTFSDYLAYNKLPIAKNVTLDDEAVQLIITSFTELLKLERVILNDAAEIGDEGTNGMMSSFIALQEKNIWMLNAFLQA